MQTSQEIRNKTKDAQILYLRNEIMKLEYQQLSESILSIKGKTPATKLQIKQMQTKKEAGIGNENIRAGGIYSDYELCFDEAIKVAPTIIDLQSVRLLNKYRRDVLFTSLYDATLASTLQFNQETSKSQKTISRPGKRLIPENKPLKQITSLFDEDILGREIDLTQMGMCHHCKQIKPKNQLVTCNFKTSPHQGTNKNAIGGLAFKCKKFGQRSLPHSRCKKSVLKQCEYRCERYFCQVCINLNYDIPLENTKSPNWICPYCSVFS